MESSEKLCGICLEEASDLTSCQVCKRFNVCKPCVEKYSTYDSKCPQCRDVNGFPTSKLKPSIPSLIEVDVLLTDLSGRRIRTRITMSREAFLDLMGTPYYEEMNRGEFVRRVRQQH